jgi:UDP-N-acetylmuramate--alanine ligase
VHNDNFSDLKYHFIGIGGVGVGALAMLCLQRGCAVSGSDVSAGKMTALLTANGAKIRIGHSPAVDSGITKLVYSSAIKSDNIELQSARMSGIECVKRADFLSELMQSKRSVTICGTHGKTTTTGLTISALTGCGVDPSFAVGGLHRSINKYANFGKGDIFIAEADESDASFLDMPAEVAVITNIDYDHMETYAGDFMRLKSAFKQFVQQLPPNGCAVVCWDDPAVRDIMHDYNRKIISYGEHDDADVRLLDFKQHGLRSNFSFSYAGSTYNASIAVPGLHNVINSLAAIAIALHFELPIAQAISGLDTFGGMGRRFHVHGETEINNKTVLLLEDYAHHPRALEVTLLAAKQAWPEKRILLVAQLHRYSRVSALFNDFVNVLCLADEVLLPPIYAASEAPITNIDSAAVANAVKANAVQCHNLASLDAVRVALQDLAQQDDILLFVGAGNMGASIAACPDALHAQQSEL